VLSREAGFDDRTIERLEAILERSQTAREALHRTEREHHRALKQLTESQSRDEAAFDRAVSGLLQTRRQLQTLRDEEVAAMRKELKPSQQARLLLALPKVMREGRKLMRSLRKEILRDEIKAAEEEDKDDDDQP
jgi:hypothetical protein